MLEIRDRDATGMLAELRARMNQIFIPIEGVHLETVFERGERVEYALLQPKGGVSPLRIRFEDLRRELQDRFSAELSAETIVDRIARMEDEQLLITVTLERDSERRWSVSIRNRFPFETLRKPAELNELRRSPRRKPDGRKDVRVELGERSLDGTVYNISEHGLGIAVLTTQLEQLGPFRLDQAVEIIDEKQQRVSGRIRSQYPASGGCVLGIELKERLRMPGVPDIEA
jgi:hypothetical protein